MTFQDPREAIRPRLLACMVSFSPLLFFSFVVALIKNGAYHERQSNQHLPQDLFVMLAAKQQLIPDLPLNVHLHAPSS